MGIEVQIGGEMVPVQNSGTEAVGTPVLIDGVVCIQGNDSQSSDGLRNAYYPNGQIVYRVDKAESLGVVFSNDDVVNYDTVSGLAVTTAADNVTIFKIGVRMAGTEAGGADADGYVWVLNEK